MMIGPNNSGRSAATIMTAQPAWQLPITQGLPSAWGCSAMTFSRNTPLARAISWIVWPGIGGFKADSEIGVALKAGHPCYFIGFLPDPVPGQTIEDIARAEGVFRETVISLHPEADGKPCVIGNCQAGWAVMILASLRPELFGPIIIAGAPLSYWAGVHGKNPMR